MKALDVVTALASRLPLLTDKVTTTIPVESVQRSGSIVTVRCLERHGLEPLDVVAIVGASTPIPAASLTRSGTVGTLDLSSSHDLTPKIASEIVLSGSNEAEFNGTFPISKIVDSDTIEFVMADSGPTTATGSPILENGESALRQYDGAYAVLDVLGDSVFTFEHDGGLPDPVGSIEVRAKPRITAAATAERMIDAYTSQDDPSDLWVFVVLEDVVASKSRDVESDAVSNVQRSAYFRQQIIQPFSVYLVMPSETTISGRFTRDLAEELFRPICRSILFLKLDSGLHAGKQHPVQFASHGAFQYDAATYVHQFGFQQTVDVLFEDTTGPDLDVAFRQIDLDMIPTLPGGAGTMLQSLKATPRLDEPAEE